MAVRDGHAGMGTVRGSQLQRRIVSFEEIDGFFLGLKLGECIITSIACTRLEPGARRKRCTGKFTAPVIRFDADFNKARCAYVSHGILHLGVLSVASPDGGA